MSLRTILVDDEAPARAELRYLLERFPSVSVVGEAGSAGEAEALLATQPCDALFLDIQMPGLGGLDWAALLGRRRRQPRLVFVTAFDEYALEAFGLRAVDYLLKPVEPARLADTVDRLMEQVAAQQLRALPGQEGERLLPLPLEALAYLEARGDEVQARLVDGRRVRVREPLHRLERLLPGDRFCRCHRAFIVNLRQVDELVPLFHGTYRLRLRAPAGAEVPVSRNGARRLRQAFGWPP
ncbi:MAG: LytTR family DNA-binding domain-containing protein [Bacillota bacterium]|nr:LytTR family DNA-binding domain-containing protein [Bacillota bacterium]